MKFLLYFMTACVLACNVHANKKLTDVDTSKQQDIAMEIYDAFDQKKYLDKDHVDGIAKGIAILLPEYDFTSLSSFEKHRLLGGIASKVLQNVKNNGEDAFDPDTFKEILRVALDTRVLLEKDPGAAAAAYRVAFLGKK